jgi:hypothetical protein
MNRKEMLKRLKKNNCEILDDFVDFRIQDSTNWYDSDTILSVKKDDKIYSLSAVGQIRIYTKNKHFVFKGGKPDGELNNYIKKNGEWENNNWFEITENGTADLGDVFYELDNAVENLIERMESR